MFIVEVKHMSELRSNYEEVEKESSLMEIKGNDMSWSFFDTQFRCKSSWIAGK